MVLLVGDPVKRLRRYYIGLSHGDRIKARIAMALWAVVMVVAGAAGTQSVIIKLTTHHHAPAPTGPEPARVAGPPSCEHLYNNAVNQTFGMGLAKHDEFIRDCNHNPSSFAEQYPDETTTP